MKIIRTGLALAIILLMVLALPAQTPSPASSPSPSPSAVPADSGQTSLPPEAPPPLPSPAFQEIWGYLMNGEEGFYKPDYPITDLAYFSANLNSYGELTGIPDPKKLKAKNARLHLVVAILDNYALTHLALSPEFPVRAKLLDELTSVIEPYDGLQLDFEAIPNRDKENFWTFLRDLRSRMGSKPLSIAIPARTRAFDDAYDYRTLNDLVDRIIIMAYDEHWSGSKPGAIASLDWCKKVALYSQGLIAPEKLVMGAPFYGRAWADKSVSKAYKYSGITKLQSEKNIVQVQRDNSIPRFEYQETVNVQVFFEDAASGLTRLQQYADLKVNHAAFWRLGQEDPVIWNMLSIQPPAQETGTAPPSSPGPSPEPSPMPSASPIQPR